MSKNFVAFLNWKIFWINIIINKFMYLYTFFMFSKASNYSIFFVLPISLYFWHILYNYFTEFRYTSLIWNLNFFIHEFWHIFFSIFWNKFLIVAWWTLMQLIIPLLVLILFLKQKDYFAVNFSLFWIWVNLLDISIYAWDAIKMDLPLISIWWWDGWEVIHDWFYMLTELQLISYTDEISFWIKSVAIFLFLFYFLYTILLVVNRFREWDI